MTAPSRRTSQRLLRSGTGQSSNNDENSTVSNRVTNSRVTSRNEDSSTVSEGSSSSGHDDSNDDSNDDISDSESEFGLSDESEDSEAESESSVESLVHSVDGQEIVVKPKTKRKVAQNDENSIQENSTSTTASAVASLTTAGGVADSSTALSPAAGVETTITAIRQRPAKPKGIPSLLITRTICNLYYFLSRSSIQVSHLYPFFIDHQSKDRIYIPSL